METNIEVLQGILDRLEQNSSVKKGSNTQTPFFPIGKDTSALLVDAKEAARLCGIGLRTWHTLTSAGRTPNPLRLGRRVLWRRDELLAWIDAGCPPRHNWEWPLEGHGRATA